MASTTKPDQTGAKSHAVGGQQVKPAVEGGNQMAEFHHGRSIGNNREGPMLTVGAGRGGDAVGFIVPDHAKVSMFIHYYSANGVRLPLVKPCFRQ